MKELDRNSENQIVGQISRRGCRVAADWTCRCLIKKSYEPAEGILKWIGGVLPAVLLVTCNRLGNYHVVGIEAKVIPFQAFARQVFACQVFPSEGTGAS